MTAAALLAPLATMPGLPLLGSLLDFRRDRTSLLLCALAAHPQMVAMRLAFIDVAIDHSAEGAHEVLVEKHHASAMSRPAPGRRLMGRCLLP
jgi:hypothetical protein